VNAESAAGRTDKARAFRDQEGNDVWVIDMEW